MKTFRSEFINEYSTYTFSYADYAIMESAEDFKRIYASGYLPYSADLELKYPLFYLARSLRVDTNIFTDSSENRRIDRKAQIYTPKINKTGILKFNTDEERFFDFCYNYAKQRFSQGAISRERLKYIFNIGVATDIFEIKFHGFQFPVAYVLAVCNEDLLHFWFSFYDLELSEQFPLGKWVMWRLIKYAKDAGIPYIYLGTTYMTKSLYKVRDFNGLEFFDGSGWNNDIELLKKKIKNDDNSSHISNDEFKTMINKNEFISNLISKSEN